MGDTVTLICRSIGGNPLAQLVWYKNDEQVDFSYTTTSNRQSSNSHTFVVDSSDNNAIYRCVGSSSITDTPIVSEVKLQVHFAPSKVTITGTKDAKSGDTVTISCKTERSNPPSEISWVVDGRPITASNTIVADPSGGWITSANVTVTITNQVIIFRDFVNNLGKYFVLGIFLYSLNYSTLAQKKTRIDYGLFIELKII
jgi:hypothetical protein